MLIPTVMSLILQMNAKYDKKAEMDAKKWIEDVIEEPVEWGEDDDNPGSGFAEGLKSGKVLGKYVSHLVTFKESRSIPFAISAPRYHLEGRR